jgi:geranylgeranyl diphosphate synthase, type II
MSTGTSSIFEALDGYNAATAAVIARYLSDREPGRHLYDPVRSFTMGRGKGLRPALCLAACEAFGGSAEPARLSAAAVELLHAAFLIHDDIEDGSEKRRGTLTLHVEHGVPIALNVGDALAILCLRPLLDNVSILGSRLARDVFTEFQVTMERTVEGQAIELGWRHDNVTDLTPLDYLDMILRKTCAYTTILPLRVGALIGSLGSANLDAITEFGFAIGAAFQIQDDLLDLRSGEPYGKDVLGDIREGKRTLMLLHFLRVAGPHDRARVVAFLNRPRESRSAGDIRAVFERIGETGSIAYAENYATELVQQAQSVFGEAFAGCAPSSALEFLRDLAPFMTERLR